MPETENDKTVELDVTGPGATIELPEAENDTDKTFENEVKKNEANITYDNEPNDTPEKSDEQPVLRDEKNEGGEVVQKTSEEGGDKQKDNSKDVEEYSEGVKKRIAKLTKKMREAERQKDEALSYANRIKSERDRYEATATGLDRNYASEMEGRITSSLAAAQAKLAAARTNEDAKAEVEALTSISQLGYEQGKLAEIKSQHAMQDSAANEKPTLQQQPVRQPAPVKDPKAEAWADENDWFGKDNAMTYTAFDLHRKLTEEEGMDPQSDEYYNEVDKRIRLEFPHKFDKVEQKISKPTQNVASATRSSKTGRKTVKLTPTQVTIARKLGVPLEEYAKQLINTKEV
jgi:hypothetical protein